MTDQTPATAAGRALVLRLASPDPLGPRSYAEAILAIEAEARALDRDALAEALDRLVNAAVRQPNGYHVCRWCGQNIGDYTGGHAANCQWVQMDRELAEAKTEARALLAREAPAASPEASDELRDHLENHHLGHAPEATG